MGEALRTVMGRLVRGVIPLAVALWSSTAAAAASDPAPITPDPHLARKAPLREGEDEERGLLGPVRLGVLTGVSLPRPVSVEALLKVRDVVGLGVEYSVLPPVTVSGVHASLYALDVDVRVFLTRSGFFLGVNGGKQHFEARGSAALPMGYGSVEEQIAADTWFVGARVGVLRTWKSGFSLGMDAGAQIPVSASFTSAAPSEMGMSQTATDVAHLIGKRVLPNINLLRIGYLF